MEIAADAFAQATRGYKPVIRDLEVMEELYRLAVLKMVDIEFVRLPSETDRGATYSEEEISAALADGIEMRPV